MREPETHRPVVVSAGVRICMRFHAVYMHVNLHVQCIWMPRCACMQEQGTPTLGDEGGPLTLAPQPIGGGGDH